MYLTPEVIKEAKKYVNSPINQLFDDAMQDSTTEDYQKACIWVQENLVPTKGTIYTDRSSYSLKHLMESDIGLYVTNNVFKAAMIELGYKVRFPNYASNPDDLAEQDCNLYFNISKKSPGLKRLCPDGYLLREKCEIEQN